MNNRFQILAAALSGAVVLVSAYSCGGDDESPAQTTTTTTSASSSGNGGAGGCTTPDPKDCPEACKVLYKCTQEDDLCPGLKGTSEDDFVNGKKTGGCLEGCEGMKALIALVKPCDCAGTMKTLTQASPDLKCSCEDNCPGGGGGGAGPGGAGGADSGGGGGAGPGGSGGK